jgi:hypothetical protein
MDVPEPDGAGSTAGPGLLHLGRVLAALGLLLLPGALAFRGFVPRGTFAEALAMAPALAMILLAASGIAVLAVTHAALGPGLAAVTVVVALGLALAARLLPGRAAE